MKKYLFIVLLFLIVGKSSAQKLQSGNYTATISNVKTEKSSITVLGEERDYKEYKGNYTIEKNGKVILSNTFSTMSMSKKGMSVNIQIKEGMGNSIYYNFDTKKFDWQGDEIEAKNSKNIENIILSAILIYAQSDEG